MDEIVRKLAGIGLPAVILVITMAATGFTGAAAITAALALLGPGGMIGGIVLLGIIGLASDALAKYGLEELLIAIYKERKKNDQKKDKTGQCFCQEIDNLPIFPELKQKVKDSICVGLDCSVEMQLLTFIKKEENKKGVTEYECFKETKHCFPILRKNLDELQKKGWVTTKIPSGDGAVVYIAI
ncbi:hypothetical protein [Limnoraphis robusta]|uniref:hypothetical protein n=1 Tax=Limnoraphis robusta TaxID=1118279 RepID=UPI001F26AFCA|nr:hypothetical protein [Limnoraphis robusta]